MATTATEIQALYVAYFNRPADVLGLQFWLDRANASPNGADSVANEFSNSDEYRDLYADKTPAEIVDAIYMNLFGRHAEAEGLVYWALKLTKGELNIGNVARIISTSAQNEDQVAIDAKVSAAEQFTASLTDASEILGYSGDAANAVAKTWLAGVKDADTLAAATTEAALQAVSDAAVDAHSGEVNVPVNLNLTTGVDATTGGAGNDTINGVVNGAANSTYSALDTIDGGAGVDTLKISSITAFAVAAGATVKNIENVEIAAALDVGAFAANGTGALDFTTQFAGVTQLSVSKATEVDFAVGATTAVKVTDIVGGVEVVGGSTQSVTLADQGAAVKLSGAAGAITVASAKQDANTITVDGGTTVDVTATSSVSNSTIAVGGTKAASGVVNVTSNLNSDGSAAFTGGAINVTGGSSINVKVNAVSAAKDETSNADITTGTITVTGDGKTTSVTIDQNETETAFTKAAVAAVKETSVVTFAAMTTGQTLTFNGLTFTAAKNLTAEQVAAAFANLTAADTQSATGPVSNGIYSGAFSTGSWTSGSVSGKTVTFTAKDEDEADLVFGGTATAPTQVATAGTAGTAKVTSSNIVSFGAVRVDDVATASITNLTIDGYSGADIGVTGADLDKLTTLSLANSAGAASVQAAATTFNLTVNTVEHAVDLDVGSATITTLNVTATGDDSAFALTAAAAKDLTVAGDKALDLTGSTLTALENVTVNGAASLDLGAVVASKSVNTVGTTGTVTATINASTATYTGGAGVDNVTTSTTTVSKAINLGAGDDKLTLAAGTTSLTSEVIGGEGTDTLKMNAADAAGASATGTFETKLTSFEKLSLNAVLSGANDTVDLSNLDDISYVISANAPATVGAVSEQQTMTVTGTASAQVIFLGTAVAASVATDDAATTAGRIVTDKAALIAAWNAANPTLEISNITNVGAVLTITYANTEGNVGPLAGDTNNGITFGASVETVTGVAAATAGSLTLTKMADNGTLELTAAGAGVIVTMTDATGTADNFNIVTKVSTTDVNVGTVDTAGVEKIVVTASDILLDNNDDGTNDAVSTSSLTLKDAALTTVTVNGNANLTLALDNNVVALTSVDASALTGVLTATTNGTVAQTITGGSGKDILTSKATGTVADKLIGGEGADTLTANKGLSQLTGGAGNDIFKIDVASTNSNSAATITDAASGDFIVFANADAFKSAAIELDSTAVFQDFANAAIASITSDNDLAWFQFGGNTYIVQEKDVTTNADVFTNNQDFIVKITGAIDLSTASFNLTSHTLQLA